MLVFFGKTIFSEKFATLCVRATAITVTVEVEKSDHQSTDVSNP